MDSSPGKYPGDKRKDTMGKVFKATTKSADAPDIEVGIYDAIFNGVIEKVIEDSLYDPNVFEWDFTPLDDDGAVLYGGGDPIVLNGLTSQSLNTASKTVPKAVRYLKALCTAEEYEDFENDQGVDMDALVGRKCQIDVGTNTSGWPNVVNVLPARRARRRTTSGESA